MVSTNIQRTWSQSLNLRIQKPWISSVYCTTASQKKTDFIQAYYHSTRYIFLCGSYIQLLHQFQHLPKKGSRKFSTIQFFELKLTKPQLQLLYVQIGNRAFHLAFKSKCIPPKSSVLLLFNKPIYYYIPAPRFVPRCACSSTKNNHIVCILLTAHSQFDNETEYVATKHKIFSMNPVFCDYSRPKHSRYIQ